MSINTIGVVGAGQMGAGIAQVAASVGLNVICSDINQDACDRGHAAIAKSLGRLVKKERMSQEDADAALARVRNRRIWLPCLRLTLWWKQLLRTKG